MIMLRSPAWNVLPFLLYDGSTAADCSFTNDAESLDTLIHDLCTLGRALRRLTADYSTYEHNLVCLAASSFEREAQLCPSALLRLNFCPDHEFAFVAGHDISSLARSAFHLIRFSAAPDPANGEFPYCPLFPDFRLLAFEIQAEFEGCGSGVPPRCELPRSAAARLLANERAALRSLLASFSRDICHLARTQKCAALQLAPLLAELRTCRAANALRIRT